MAAKSQAMRLGLMMARPRIRKVSPVFSNPTRSPKKRAAVMIAHKKPLLLILRLCCRPRGNPRKAKLRHDKDMEMREAISEKYFIRFL